VVLYFFTNSGNAIVCLLIPQLSLENPVRGLMTSYQFFVMVQMKC